MNKSVRFAALAAILVVTPNQGAMAGFGDTLKGLFGGGDKADEDKSSLSGALSEGEMADGLKEALSLGMQQAVKLLGQDGGFLNDASVKIPMPSALEKIEKGVRFAGQGNLADQFVATMNHAAERAVPQATGIFADAIKSMSVEDAKGILTGPEDSATQYFRKRSTSSLTEAISPIVKNATDEVGVTSAYKKLVDKSGVGLLGGFVNVDALDLDKYVTE